MLPDYIQQPTGAQANANSTSKVESLNTVYKDTQAGAEARSHLTTAVASNVKTQGTSSTNVSSGKKSKDLKTAAANLEEASDLQRQKFLDTFQQMQGSPTTQAQKTYKVKTEMIAKAASATRLENPFQKSRQVVVSPIEEDSHERGVYDQQDLSAGSNGFRPFEVASPGEFKTSKRIFYNDYQAEEPSSSGQNLLGPSLTQTDSKLQMRVTTAKVDKRMQRKKGKLVKGV